MSAQQRFVRHLIVIWCGVASSVVTADTILVPTEHTSIQAAIVAANNGDEIVVARERTWGRSISSARR